MPRSLEVQFPALHPGQREVVDDPARFKVLAAGRRWRKTSLGVQVCLRASLLGRRSWWVGPSYPVAAIGWKMARHLARQIPGIDVREADRQLVFPGGGDFQVKSADNPDSLRGAGLDGVVLDEAAYIKEEAWTEALRPALADRQGWALFISTPNGLNWFYQLFERAGSTLGWARWQRPTWDNPHVPRGEIDLARSELGETIFRQEFGAEFLDAAVLKPFRRPWITYWGQGEGAKPEDPMVVEAGFDPAISKRDSACRSALVVAGQVRQGLNRGLINVLRAIAGHWSVYEGVDVLLKAVVELHIRSVRVEDVAYQRAFGQVLDREARQRGITVHVDLVAPDGDKLRRANSWSALVEDGTVRFGPGQEDLVASMIAVPQDETKWDLVDAAGLVIRGFPLMQGESMPIPGTETTTPTLAKGYATQGSRVDTPTHPRPNPQPGFRPFGKPAALRRAIGYAIRPRSKQTPVGVK